MKTICKHSGYNEYKSNTSVFFVCEEQQRFRGNQYGGIRLELKTSVFNQHGENTTKCIKQSNDSNGGHFYIYIYSYQACQKRTNM